MALHWNGKTFLDAIPEGLTQGDFLVWLSAKGVGVRVELRVEDGGFVVHGVVRGPSGQRADDRYLIAEHSGKKRVFRTADAALRTCKRMDLIVVQVWLS